MSAKIPRPSRTATTIVAKLSSARIMSAASLLTSVPVTPMATPMSADRSAGESFTPSPVIATMLPSSCRASTRRSLCSGATRAYTDGLPGQGPQALVVEPLDVGARRGRASRRAARPRSAAMRAAVRGWSPVIMTVRIPAAWASPMATRASSRGGSMMPTTPEVDELALEPLEASAVGARVVAGAGGARRRAAGGRRRPACAAPGRPGGRPRRRWRRGGRR